MSRPGRRSLTGLLRYLTARRLSGAEKAALRGSRDIKELMRAVPRAYGAPLQESVRCADKRCDHWLLGHDLSSNAMPCLTRRCPCTAFIDRSRMNGGTG